MQLFSICIFWYIFRVWLGRQDNRNRASVLILKRRNRTWLLFKNVKIYFLSQESSDKKLVQEHFTKHKACALPTWTTKYDKTRKVFLDYYLLNRTIFSFHYGKFMRKAFDLGPSVYHKNNANMVILIVIITNFRTLEQQ